MTKRHGAIITGRLDNYAATVDPTINDDSGDGYDVGSIWVNTTSPNVFLCIDSTVGAAFWRCITLPPNTGNPGSTQSIISLVPHGVFSRATGNLSLTNILGNFGLVAVRTSILVARLAFQATTAGDAAAVVRIALYPLDGQTKLIDGTAATTGGGTKNFTCSPILLDPGYYYAFACRSDANGGVAPQIASYATGFSNAPVAGPSASLIDIMGTLAVTGGAAPTNFDPTGLTVADACPVIRLDIA